MVSSANTGDGAEVRFAEKKPGAEARLREDQLLLG